MPDLWPQMTHIFADVLTPVLVMVALGAVIQRIKPLDVDTLVKLNLYLFIPAFLFVSLHRSELRWSQIGGIGVAVLAPIALLGVPIYLTLRRTRASGRTIAAVVVGGLFFNAGNLGLPVAKLAYGADGAAVQSLVVAFMNTTIFFVGYGILALAQGRGASAILGYFKLPMIYVIVAALVMRQTATAPPAWLDAALTTIADGMVPIALVTLGAQLAQRARWPRWAVITPVLLLKLAVMPLATALVVWAMGLWPWPGAMLIVAASAPTAVNTLLLTLELEGDADTAADCVFWTTLLCAATVTVTLALVKANGGMP